MNCILRRSSVRFCVRFHSTFTNNFPQLASGTQTRTLQVQRFEIVTSTSLRTSSTNTESQKKVKVLYDGECPICMKEIEFLSWLHNRRGTDDIDFIDITKGQYNPSENAGVSYQAAMDEMHVIGKDGKVYTRVPAFEQMYGAVGLKWIVKLINLPGVAPVLERMYTWFAKNRLKWTGRQNCETGRCEMKSKKS